MSGDRTYAFLKDDKRNIWILFRVEGAKHMKVIESPKRRIVARAFKRVNGFNLTD